VSTETGHLRRTKDQKQFAIREEDRQLRIKSSATIEIESEHKGKKDDLNYYSHCG
jgi:hypothetical protein